MSYIKATLTVAAALLALSFVKVHATTNVHIKQQPAPPTYLVEGKEVNAAEATLAVLQGRTAMKCTQMEVEASRSGLSLKAKKNN